VPVGDIDVYYNIDVKYSLRWFCYGVYF
jgi:hypothetical protein